jgi:hypothetical protein
MFSFGYYPASEIYVPTFRNTIFVPELFGHALEHELWYTHLPAYEDGTEIVPKRRHINLRRQKKTCNI